MTNILTETDIANMALDWVGGLNIQSIDDTNNPLSVLCKRHLGQCVRAEINKYEWTFARKFANAVAVDTTAHPEAAIEGYIAYHLPADFSRLSQYFFNEFYPHRTNQYQPHHNYFLTAKYLYTRRPLDMIPYITQNPAIADYPVLFCDMCAMSLATRIAKKVAGLDSDVSFLETYYDKKVREARRQNVLQLEASPTGITETQQARVGYFGGF